MHGSLKGFLIEFVHRDEVGHLVTARRHSALDRLLVRFERRLNVPLIDPALIRHCETDACATA